MDYYKKKRLVSMGDSRLIALLLTTVLFSYAENRIAVIDTGLDLKDARIAPYLCKSGHIDFTGEGLEDKNGHGTHVVGLIIQHAREADYCLVILKYYHNSMKEETTKHIIAAEKEAVRLKAKIVNISSGGDEYSVEEDIIIKSAKKTIFVVSAGNNGRDIARQKYYPASLSHPNMRVVGNIRADGTRHPTSNYGDTVDNWEVGSNLLSILPYGRTGLMSGTSMSTAVKTGKLIYERFGPFN